MTAPAAQAWAYGASGASTATWSGTALTDTVTSGGAVVATFAGQCYAYLSTPLPGLAGREPVMTQRVIVADGCQQIDSPLSGARYYARGASAFEGGVKGGVFEMSDADARMAVRMGGAIASLAGTTRGGLGWRCGACGFGSYLKSCGRCGAECAREGTRGGP